jgi:pyruvate-ferredoxin/flavodoxin oxidoreductase
MAMPTENGVSFATHGAIALTTLAFSFACLQSLLLKLVSISRRANDDCLAVISMCRHSVLFRGMSLFKSHADLSAPRSSGITVLASNIVRDAWDIVVIFHLPRLPARLPFTHLTDGFRTSDETHTMTDITDVDLL